MTPTEKLDRLREWEAHLRDLESAWDKLHALTGAALDGPLGDATWCVFDAYTNAIGDIIGDEANCMDWYWIENKLGERALGALGNNGEVRPIKTLEDLLWLIELDSTS